MTRTSKSIVKKALANVLAISAEDASGLVGAPGNILLICAMELNRAKPV
jgi:hypothetical protein